MKNKIEKVKKIKEILIYYEDGTIIGVPENKMLGVGTAFMKAVGKEKFEWRVLKIKKPSFIGRIKNFFEI